MSPPFTRVRIASLEDLRDAVYGAGLSVTQLSGAPVTGSLVFSVDDGLLFSSGFIDGRVVLKGPLSERMVTLGIGLQIGAGSRHWLNEVATGDVGVFMPGDDHDALYAGRSLYAAVTLSGDRLEEEAARAGLVLDSRRLGGTGISSWRADPETIAYLRQRYLRAHGGSRAVPAGRALLDAAILHFAREPRPGLGRPDPRGLARIVASARDFIHARLDEPLPIDAIAAAAGTSRRTLQRAFHDVLSDSVRSYVLKLRLHRARQQLLSDGDAVRSVALAANRWGIGELGRFAGRYRALFGELPSQTAARPR